jgi:hypothetical protein
MITGVETLQSAFERRTFQLQENPSLAVDAMREEGYG